MVYFHSRSDATFILFLNCDWRDMCNDSRRLPNLLKKPYTDVLLLLTTNWLIQLKPYVPQVLFRNQYSPQLECCKVDLICILNSIAWNHDYWYFFIILDEKICAYPLIFYSLEKKINRLSDLLTILAFNMDLWLIKLDKVELPI